MAKKKPKNKNKLFLSFISSFLLLFSLSLIFFQISKKPKEVKAVAGQLNINAVSGGVQNFNQVGIGGDVTGSSAKLYVNGNVGIGTTTPYSGYKLHVAGNMGIGDTPGWGAPGMLFDYIDGRTGEFRFRGIRWNEIFRWGHTANGYDWVPTMELSGNVLSLYNNNSAPGSISIRFHPQGGNSFINSGNVGIGTTTPGAKLEVVGKIQATDDEFRSLMNTVDVRMGAETFATGQGAIGTLSNHPFDVYTSGTRRLRVDTTGNVGIGTTGPGYKLHVMGDIYANGGWLRTSGSAGWYSESYGGGWYMSDTSWIRTYNSKSVWTDTGLLGSNGGLTIGYGGASSPFGGAIIAGNVGIGTTAPGAKLHVHGGTGTFISVSGAMPAGDGNQGIIGYSLANSSAGDYWTMYLADPDGGFGVIPRAFEIWEYPANLGSGVCCRARLRIMSSDGLATPAEVVIDPVGNVGIGTMSPGAKLHVVAAGGFGAEPIRAQSNSTFFSGVDAGGTVRFAINNDPGPTLNFYGYDNNWFNFMTVNNAGSRAVSFNAGNVGIGTTVPWYKLHVMGDIYANGGWLRTSGSAGWYSESYGGGWYMSDTSWIRTYNSKSVWTDSGLLGNNGGLTIGYGGTSPPFGGAIIANNVGIGTTNPQSKLSIGTSGNSYYAVSVDTGSNGVYSKGSSTGVYSHGNNFGVYGVSGGFGVYGYGGNFGVYGEGGNVGVYGYSNFNTGVSGYGGTYDFYAANSNGKSYFAGNVGIGTTSPAYRLELPNIANASGQGRANAWVTYSDIRFKENITPINNALEKINSLQGVYFDWKQNGKRDIGFIAQEVEKVLPEIVSTDPSGIKSLDYSRLTALLVQGIKEQQQQISYQSTRLSLLEKDLNLTSIGDLKIVGEDSKFEVRNSKNDLVTKIAAFSEIIVGKIKAGLIETKKLIVDGVDIVKKISELEQKLEKQEQIIRNQQKEIEALKEIVGKLKK